jgi:hypothetical protein
MKVLKIHKVIVASLAALFISSGVHAQINCSAALAKIANTSNLPADKYGRLLSMADGLTVEQRQKHLNEFIKKNVILGPLQSVAMMMALVKEVEPNLISASDLAGARLRWDGSTKGINSPKGRTAIIPIYSRLKEAIENFSSIDQKAKKETETFLDRSFETMELLIEILSEPSGNVRNSVFEKLDLNFIWPQGAGKWTESLNYLKDLKKDPVKYQAFRQAWVLSASMSLKLANSTIKNITGFGHFMDMAVLTGITISGFHLNPLVSIVIGMIEGGFGGMVKTLVLSERPSHLAYPITSRIFSLGTYFKKKLMNARARQLVVEHFNWRKSQGDEYAEQGASLEKAMDRVQDWTFQEEMKALNGPIDLQVDQVSSIQKFDRRLVRATYLLTDSLALLESRLDNNPEEMKSLLKQASARGLTPVQSQRLLSELRKRISQMDEIRNDYEDVIRLLQQTEKKWQEHQDFYQTNLEKDISAESQHSMKALGERLAAQRAIFMGFRDTLKLIGFKFQGTSDALQGLEIGLLAKSLTQTLASAKMQAFLKDLENENP